MSSLAALLLLAAGVLSSPAPSGGPEACPPPPPGAENPSAGGFGFGLGLDLLSDEQGGLGTAASSTTVTLRRADGSEESFVRPGDPELEDRKFGKEVSFRGLGLQVPVAVPSFSLGPAVAVHPAIVLEASLVETEVEIAPLTEPGPTTSLEGSGVMLGVGIDWVATACRRCRLFWGGGYRYRLLPELELDRSVGAVGPGLEVLRDEVHLSAESHRVAARLGYAFRGGRVAPYLGVRYRATDLELEDELRLEDPILGQETGLDTRIDLEGEGAAAVLGLDVTVAGRYAVRLEAAVGDDDASALLNVVGFLGAPPGRPHAPSEVEELLREGPDITLTSRRLCARGLVRGGWPVVVEYVLPEDGTLRLTIEAPGHRELVYPLSGRAGEPMSEMRDLPARLGDDLVPGTFRLEAVSAGGDAIPFRFLALGAGRGAIASAAIRDVRFQARGAKTAEYSFRLAHLFSHAEARFLRWPDDPRQPSIPEEPHRPFTPPRCVEPGRPPCQGEWEAPRAGLYVLQVTAWRGDREDGDWVAAVSFDEADLRP